MSQAPGESNETVVLNDIVPTVDLSEPLSVVGAKLDEAYSSVGFCQVVGHSLDSAIEEAAWRAAQEFFALSDEDKRQIVIPDGQAYGYAPFRSERLAASLGMASPPDLKETFSMGPLSVPAIVESDESAAFAFSPNLWPTDGQDLRRAMEAHYRQLSTMAETVMSALAVALDLDAAHFEPFINEHTAALRALHYPHIGTTELPADQLRAGAHADYGTLTLLRQDDAPGGLEVLGLDEAWHPVISIPGAYVVNIGDTLARWSNNRWRSTVHRVAVPPTVGAGVADPAEGSGDSNERYSMAYFHNANWDATIECLPNCVPDGATPSYDTITAGQHLMQKFRSTQR